MRRVLRHFLHIGRVLRGQSMGSALSAAAIMVSVLVLSVVHAMNTGIARQAQALEKLWRGKGTLNAFGSPMRAGARTIERNSISLDDVGALNERLGDRALLAHFIVRPGVRAAAEGASIETDVFAQHPNWFEITGHRLQHGRLLDMQDEQSSTLSCVIGSDVAEALFPADDPVGKRLRLDSTVVRVVGVFARLGPDIQGYERDTIVSVPFSTGQKRLMAVEGVRGVEFRPTGKHDLAAIAEEIANLIRERHGILPGAQDDFQIWTGAVVSDQYRELFAPAVRVGVILTIVTIVVSAVVVWAVFTTATRNRRREVGLKRALGATRRNVLFGFLAEAGLLALVAAGFGLGLTGMIATIAPRLSMTSAEWSSWPMGVSATTILFAGLGAIVPAVISTIVPAWRASNQDPASILVGR